jgi:hypothetical protein
MKLEQTAHWLTIAGNIGLLIGLALVIVQIEQNTDLVRLQLSSARWTDDLSLHLTMMGENPAVAVAKAIEDPTSLTIEDVQVLEAYRLYWGLSKLRQQAMYERGMDFVAPPSLEPDDARTELAIRVLGNAYMKASHEEAGIGGPLFATRIQPLMDSLTGNENREQYERLLARLQEAR